METSDFILSMRAAPGQVPRALGQVLAAGDDAPVPSLAEQAEENALRHLAAGYQPGATLALAQQIGEVSAELEAERAKVEAGRRRSEQVTRMHQEGRIRAWDVPRMLGGDLGDPNKVETLERHLESLRRQRVDAAEVTAGVAQRARQESMDPVEYAARAAHRAFAETTRAMMADAEAGRSPRRERRPFVSRSATVSAEVCGECHRLGVTDGEHAELHRLMPADAGAGREISR